MNTFLEIAKKAAYQAGEFLLTSLDGTREIHYKGKGHYNPFSQIDEKAETIIFGAITSAFPEHNFISEERGKKITASDYTWIIDPLDGTINFIHKYRYFSVSISLLYQDEAIVGVIYNPLVNEMFTAVKDRGAYLNEKRIKVSPTAGMDKSLLSMGFPYDRNSEAFSQSVKNFIRLVRDCQALRRDGSTALDLCSVACGRYDGFSITGNEVWDYAAGTLIVTEAGGKVTDFKGNPFHVNNTNNEVLATNGKIHELIVKRFAEEDLHGQRNPD